MQPTSWRRTGTTQSGFRMLTSDRSGRSTPRPQRVDYVDHRPAVRVPRVDEPLPATPELLDYYRHQQEMKRGAVRQAITSLIRWPNYFSGVRVAPAMVPFLRALWEYARSVGISLRLVSGYRSPQQQAALRMRWESGDPSVVYPPAQHSYHESGLAVDLESSRLSDLGRFWESLGGRWGGRFGDPVHFDFGVNKL